MNDTPSKGPSTPQPAAPRGTFDLTSLAPVAPGSIVSRTLVNRPVGTITFFAFDAGQGLSEHSAPYDAFVQVIEGKAEITIGGAPSLLGPGQAIIMPANVPHAVQAPEPMKMLLTMIRG